MPETEKDGMTIKDFYEMACRKGIENLKVLRIIIEDLPEDFMAPEAYYVEKKKWSDWE